MDTNSVWDFLSSISIGTMVAWIVVILAIFAAISVGAIKLYKIFDKYRTIKDRNEEQRKTIEKHEKMFTEVNESLKQITTALEEQRAVNYRQLRYSIVRLCDDAIADGKISAGKLKSLEEMYKEYTDIFHGNGYVKTMVKKTRSLPVVGKLDE